MDGTVWHVRGQERYVQSFAGETWWKQPRERRKCRWDVCIKTNLQQIEWNIGLD
jgi:hypothetical protein